MFKVKFDFAPEKLANNMFHDIEAVAPKIVEAFSKEVETSARRNFNQAVDDISGDNPFVSVQRTVNNDRATITCSGEQVLFAEFGAGLQNSYREYNKWIEPRTVSRNGTTYTIKGHWRTIGLNARGFAFGGRFEDKIFYERPAGIVPLGHYGIHGIDDFWFRPSKNGRVGSMETWKRNHRGEVDPRYVWTMGTRPVRALARARNSAINKLVSGRLKIK